MEITLVDTNINTLTGGRLKGIKIYKQKDFCFTYGDGLSNVNIKNLIKFHKTKKLATVTSVISQRFGVLNIKNNLVKILRKNQNQALLLLMVVFLFIKKSN